MSDFARKEKLRLVSKILDLYFKSATPDKSKPYWYGDVFDRVYDKGLVELNVMLELYKRSENKQHL